MPSVIKIIIKKLSGIALRYRFQTKFIPKIFFTIAGFESVPEVDELMSVKPRVII